MRLYCRIVDLPALLTQAGITTIAFELDLNATFHEDGPGDGSLGPAHSVVQEVPVTVSPGLPAPPAAGEPKKRGRKKAAADTAALADPASVADAQQPLYAPMPLPTRSTTIGAVKDLAAPHSLSPTISGSVRTYPANPELTPATSANGGVQVAGYHPGTPIGTSIEPPTFGGFSGAPTFGQGVAPWATPAVVPVATQMTLQQIHGVMLKAHQTNPDGFAQAMAAASLQPNAVTVADGARVVAALAPIVGVN